jgi:PAS domain S-box-containing protein
MEYEKKSLIILEDEEAHAKAIRKSLSASENEYEISFATSLEEFNQIITSLTPDLIIADMNLPDGSAFTLLNGKLESNHLPIVVMTSYGDEELAVKAIKSGALDYIVKSPEAFRNIEHVVTRNLRELQNIKKAKEIEMKFRVLFETMAQGVVYQDIDGQIISANTAAEKILGITLEQMKKRNSFDPHWEAIHEDGSAFSGETHPAMLALRSGLPVRDTVMGIHYPQEKEYRWVLISAIPQFRENETKPYQVFTSFTDITELKKNEKALLESENRLKELNATKDKLFSILSHDLKGPFTSIVGFSELLIKDIREKNFDALENFAKVIIDSSENAMNLLTNLIEWSRLQTGRIKFDPMECEINTIVSEVVGLLFASAAQKSISIISELPPNQNIFADKFMINTVLRNIISNAIKFSYPGGKILISALKQKSAVLIKITDNGVGMSPESIKKLFNFEANFSTPGTQNEKGTGLGMIICKEFIAKHTGKIWVESEIGKGSSFFFTLPNLRF